MIWLNIKELETRLVNGKVSEKLGFTYLLAHLILISITSHIKADEDPLWMVLVHLLISLGATIFGVKKAYEINRQGGNRDFLTRFLSLSFVAGVRCLIFVFFIIILWTAGVMVAAAIDDSFSLSMYNKIVLELGGFVLFVGLYYFILLRSFKKINSEAFPGV